MNKLKISALGILLSASLLGNAQENQNVKAEKVGDKVITEYNVEYSRSTGEYSYTGCCKYFYQLTFQDFDGKKSFVSQRTESTASPTSYYADEEVFPVTFIKGRKRGNKEQTERLKVIAYTMSERIVFLDGWIYELHDWVSKDDYTIEKIYADEEAKGFKAVMGSIKKMEAAGHEERLQKYLDEAFAKQAELLPAWKEANADLVQRRIDNDKILTAEIQGKNAEYWASEEGQAIKKRNEMANKNNAEDAKKEVKLIYRGSGTVKFGYANNSWSAVLGAGQSTTLECGKDIYIYRDVDGTSKRAEMVSSAGSNCAGTVEVK